MGSPEELTARFREKLEQLVLDPELRTRLGDAAAKRMSELYTWDAKGRMIHEIYRWVLGQRADKPDLDRIFSEGEPALRQTVV